MRSFRTQPMMSRILLISSLCLAESVRALLAEKNNVCSNIVDYYTIETNPNCWYDLSAEGSVPDIIRGYGYPLETHEVKTTDGYYVTLFRIPNFRSSGNKGVIFFQHGLLASSADFFGRGNESIGFLLNDDGYDVWLANTRGCEYSEKHESLTVNDFQYWNYSLDDVSQKDIPVVLEYIVEKTGQKGNIIGVAHSLGTTILAQYASGLPDHARRHFKFMIFLGPALSLKNMISPLKVITPFHRQIYDFITLTGLTRAVSQGPPQRQLLKDICLHTPEMMVTCMRLFNLFYGPFTQMTADKPVFFFNHFPSGVSIKILHWSASMVATKMSKYDYGSSRRNARAYGNSTPPVYDLGAVPVPVFMMAARNDWACGAKDAISVYKELSPEMRHGLEIVEVTKFNHDDFLFGKNVKTLVYDKLIRMINKINGYS